MRTFGRCSFAHQDVPTLLRSWVHRLSFALIYIGETEMVIANVRVRRTDVKIRNKRGLRLECSLFEPCIRTQAESPCVIYVHGNGGCRLDSLPLLPYLLPKNVCMFTFDFAGAGISEGEYISLGHHEKDDLDAAVDYLLSTKRISAIALWGRSLGASTSILFAQSSNYVSALVADSPFSKLKLLLTELIKDKTHLPDMIVKGALSIIRETIISKVDTDIDQVNVCAAAEKVKCPGIIAVGQHDEVTKPHHAKEVFDAYKGPKKMVQFKGGHNSERPRELYEVAVQFVISQMRKAPPLHAVNTNYRNKPADVIPRDTTASNFSDAMSTMSRGRVMGIPSIRDTNRSDSSNFMQRDSSVYNIHNSYYSNGTNHNLSFNMSLRNTTSSQNFSMMSQPSMDVRGKKDTKVTPHRVINLNQENINPNKSPASNTPSHRVPRVLERSSRASHQRSHSENHFVVSNPSFSDQDMSRISINSQSNKSPFQRESYNNNLLPTNGFVGGIQYNFGQNVEQRREQNIMGRHVRSQSVDPPKFLGAKKDVRESVENPNMYTYYLSPQKMLEHSVSQRIFGDSPANTFTQTQPQPQHHMMPPQQPISKMDFNAPPQRNDQSSQKRAQPSQTNELQRPFPEVRNSNTRDMTPPPGPNKHLSAAQRKHERNRSVLDEVRLPPNPRELNRSNQRKNIFSEG
eukprot:TRINITY_DN5661_c0_g3_i1.p1 TRINITY_DN5661_c0_g3~~TRINITY_DN5661_c0_g3_i1.p1  ORF type:complete len:685 (+),score=103.60 TRINITY_DN5661_c0_g3_i1:88-2142(+)